ncbi:MAG TPA: DUF3426 domain-containing protein [Casimicrobiaceae bacterium]|jgi:predicted Zn finger-like uncharacterized protein|nr:DUF3426 domain-containing protein [Casimicrobiaceae bacterium]
MAHEQYTRCPGCSTIFRVTPEQLTLRGGQVRCGHCRTVFDGNAQLISLAPTARAEGDPEPDELAAGPPTVTLRSAHALRPAHEEASARDAPRAAAAAAAAPPLEADEEPDQEVDYDSRFAWDKPKPRSRARSALYAAAIPVLLIALAAQAIFHFRDALAAHWPQTRPMLVRMCAAAGCVVRPLRDVGALSIDASDLQADPAHKGLLILSATLRNRAGYALAYPYLELTLTDSSDQVVVRRALAPEEYAGGTADIGGGIPANGESVVRLFIDASATQQAGYRLYLFYP